ncbi:MAG TPA: hypothetical protein VLM84_07755 [Chromatiaceae bacterium]|nr:hypothetical protein [Chromatiaceae bacterium]
MRILFRLLVAVLVLTLVAVVGVVLISEGQPLVPSEQRLTEQQRVWAEKWVKANDPRRRRDGAKVNLALSQEEAGLLANHFLSLLGPGQARVVIKGDRLALDASLGLPWNPTGAYLNLQLALLVVDGRPQAESASVGGLPLPPSLAKALLDRALDGLNRAQVLDSIALTPGRAVIAYTWRRGAVDTVGTNLLSPEEQARLRLYQAKALALAPGQPVSQPISLAVLLSALLTEAADRSTEVDADPVAENRAALAAAAAYANRRLVRDLSGADVTAPRPPMHPITLAGRRDLAKHFTSSAALAAQGGSLFSDAVGLFKELTDANGGSGFSFADLAADRAGVRLAELATENPQQAGLLQQAARAGLAEGDLMIELQGLPEALTRDQFERDYGGTQGEPYLALAEGIERRIDGLRLHRLAQGVPERTD